MLSNISRDGIGALRRIGISLAVCVSLASASCSWFGKKPGAEPVVEVEELAVSSFYYEISTTDNGKFLGFHWTTAGSPSAYAIYTSATGAYADIDTEHEIFFAEDGYNHNDYGFKLPDAESAPKGIRWYLLMVRDAKGNKEAYGTCSVDFGETGDPLKPVRPGEAIDQKFWGRWVRLDMGQYLYIGNRAVSYNGYVTADGYSYPDTTLELPSQLGTTSEAIYLAESVIEGPVVIKRISSELLEATVTDGYNSGASYYLYRSGTESLGFSATVKYDLDIPARFKLSRGLSGGKALNAANGVSLVIQNVLNSADRFEMTTDPNGSFSVSGAIADSAYSVTPLYKVDSGSIVAVTSIEAANAGSSSLRPMVDGEDLGVVTVTDEGYQLKASMPYDASAPYGYGEHFLVANGDYYQIPLVIANSGSAASPSCTLTLRGRDGGIAMLVERISGETATLTLPALEAGGEKSWINSGVIRISIAENAFDFAGADYVDTAITITAAGDLEWSDSIPLRVFHNETARLSFNLSDPESTGFSLSLITPEGLLVQSNGSWNSSDYIDVPLRSAATAPYRVILCGSSAISPVQYSISLGDDAATLDENAIYEARVDNTTANPAKLYMNQTFTSELAMGASAFFDLVFMAQGDITEFAPPDPFAQTLTLSWKAPDSRYFVITRSLADGSEKTVLESLADEYGATSFTDSTATFVQGKPYLYTVQGYDPLKGYTKMVTVPGYLAPWTKEMPTLGPPPTWSSRTHGAIKADPERGCLWAFADPYTESGVAHPPVLEKLDLRSGELLAGYELPETLTGAYGIELGRDGDLWIFGFKYTGTTYLTPAPSVCQFKVSATSIELAKTISVGNLKSYDLAYNFCYDPYREVLWFPLGTTVSGDSDSEGFLGFDARASSTDTSFTLANKKYRIDISDGNSLYSFTTPRLAAAEDGTLVAVFSPGTIYPVDPTSLSLGASWSVVPEDCTTPSGISLSSFEWDDDTACLAYSLYWDEAGSSRYSYSYGTRSAEGTPIKESSSASGLAAGYQSSAVVDGKRYFYASSDKAIRVLRYDDSAVRTFPISTGGSAQRVFSDSDGGFAIFDGENLVRRDSTGAFVSAFSVGGGRRLNTGYAGSPIERLEDGTGATSSWMVAHIDGLRNLDPAGWAREAVVAPFSYLSYWIDDMVGGRYLYATWRRTSDYGATESDGAFVAYDGSSRLAGAAARPAGAWGVAADGPLLAAVPDYSFDAKGKLTLGSSSTITPYSASGGSLVALSPVTLPFGALPGLARLPTAYASGYELSTTQGYCSLSFSQPYRDAAGDYWLCVDGRWAYRSASDSSYVYPPFSFIVRFDSSGTMSGFLGGSAEDYPILGTSPNDIAVNSQGRLLVLRAGTIERYTKR